MLDHQNNYIRRSNILYNDNVAKSFDILAINLSVQYIISIIQYNFICI